MNKTFWEAVDGRHSYYDIRKQSPVSNAEIRALVEHAVREVPSAFNMQSARTVVLFGKEHDALWDIVENSLRPLVPADKFGGTQEKIASFRAGYATVLFYEDQAVIEDLQEKFALYKDNFPLWSLQSSGMLQFTVWTALESEGFGASLQHYNPLIDEAVRERFHLPESWKLWGQMPFGVPGSPAEEKEPLPLEPRVLCFGE